MDGCVVVGKSDGVMVGAVVERDKVGENIDGAVVGAVGTADGLMVVVEFSGQM